MNQTAIFWPMLAHVLLVFIVYVVLAMRRAHVVRSGEAKPAVYKMRASEPEGSMTAANNLMNQFEAPVLFHVCCLALNATAGVSIVALVLAWLFVLSRYVHAAVHLTTNRLRHRNLAFRSGLLLLAPMWIWFTLHLAGAV
jgi:hypothetical protein